MGARGPAPTPTKVLKLRGTYRPDRHGGTEPVSASLTKVPRPPLHLDDDEKQIWRATAKKLIAMDLLTDIDLGALESYCVFYARALAAEAVVKVDGRMVLTPQGYKRHPELVTAEKARAEMRRYEKLFGMSPADRANLRVKPTVKSTSRDPWDEVANG